MIDQLFMKDLAFDLAPPLETEQPATLLASGPATSDVGQVTVQGYDPSRDTAGGAFVGTRLNTPKAGQAQPTLQDREKLAIGLLDTLAGALRGAAIETVALPGNIRSIVDMINKEGAEKYFGQAVAPTTEDIKKAEGFTLFGQDIPVPPVLGADVPNRAERQKSVESAEEVGAYLPAPGVPEAVVQGAKLVGKAIKATKGLPVGMSTQAVGEGVDQLGFYSAAKQAVDAIQQPKGTGDQFLKQIEKTPGVKPDEIKWTGLDEFLKSKKSVTKAEVQEYLDKNRVEVKEVQLGDLKLNEKSEYALPEVLKVLKENQSNGYSGMRLTLANDYDAYQALTKKFPNLEDTDNWEDRVLSEIIGPDAGGTKFSKWQLPGGQNYREIFMTLPTKTVSEEEARVILGAAPDAKLSEADIYYASRKNKDDYIVPRAHSADGEADVNRIAHMRVNDRVDADGKKVLFIEEIQSDWHQEGRKKGYKGSMPLDQAKQKLLNEGYTPEALANTSDADIVKSATEYGVPDAPFKTTWSELAMKRAIQMASEGGYDRIAFTTGKTQAGRYDLSKEISDLTITRNKTDFSISAVDQNGNPVIGRTIPDLRNLDEYVGKDLAEKVKDDFANKSGSEHVYSGLDLQVGGEGMKGFYDDILPKFLNKYAKKWDAKAGMTNIITNDEIEIIKANAAKAFGKDSDDYKQAVKNAMEEVHYIDITPKMRESVVTKGQPMFAIGAGGAGAAATQQEDNK